MAASGGSGERLPHPEAEKGRREGFTSQPENRVPRLKRSHLPERALADMAQNTGFTRFLLTQFGRGLILPIKRLVRRTHLLPGRAV